MPKKPKTTKAKKHPMTLTQREKKAFRNFLDAATISAMDPREVNIVLFPGTYKHRRASFIAIWAKTRGGHEHVMPVAMLLRKVDIQKHIRDSNMDPPMTGRGCGCQKKKAHKHR